MTITIASQFSQSIDAPSIGKIKLYHDVSTQNVSIKTATGNVFSLGGGQTFQTYAFDDSNNEATYKNAGSVYLQNGTLSVSSSIRFGTVNATSPAILQLYKEDSGQLAAAWTVPTGSTIDEVFLSASAAIPADGWYTVQFKINFGTDTAVFKGMRLVYE